MKNTLITSIGIVAALCLTGVTFFIYHSSNHHKSEELTVNAKEEDRITVFTSILPQEYFVARIGGNRVKVQALVTPGSSPATYEPTPRQMASLSKAKIFFRIGVPFENAFIAKLEEMTKGLHIIDTRKGITLRRKDPHIWLSPRLVRMQARTITDALSEADPAGKSDYQQNLKSLLQDLDTLDAQLIKALAPVRMKTFMVFHPAWGYFADAYGLKQEPIEVEGKEASAKQLIRMIEMARNEGVRVIFVEPQFDIGSAERIAEAIDGVVVPIDPLARDYIGNLKQVASVIFEALQEQE